MFIIFDSYFVFRGKTIIPVFKVIGSYPRSRAYKFLTLSKLSKSAIWDAICK